MSGFARYVGRLLGHGSSSMGRSMGSVGHLAGSSAGNPPRLMSTLWADHLRRRTFGSIGRLVGHVFGSLSRRS